MKKWTFIFLVVFLVSSFFFNMINDFDVFALIVNGLALIGLLTVGRSALLTNKPDEDDEDYTNYHPHDRS